MIEQKDLPELGSREAAVRSCVNLIAVATHTDEDKLAYWLDAYYQLRAAYEAAVKPFGELVVKVEDPDPVIVKLDELKDMIRDLDRNVRRADSEPVDFKINPIDKGIKQKWLERAAAEAVNRTVNAIDVSEMLRKEQEHHGGDTPGASAPTEEDELPGEPAPMKSSKVLPAEDRKAVAKAKRGAAAEEKQQKDQRAYKMRIVDRLREARAAGVKIADIVEASCGKVPDGAVMTILEGGFRPIDEYRALEAALNKCAE